MIEPARLCPNCKGYADLHYVGGTGDIKCRTCEHQAPADQFKQLVSREIRGERIFGSVNVWIGDEELPIGRSLKLARHSPTGFGWGYAGSGPAQLSLAILLEVLDDETLAMRYYQDFKFDFIANLTDGQKWKLQEKVVLAYVESKEAFRRLGRAIDKHKQGD